MDRSVIACVLLVSTWIGCEAPESAEQPDSQEMASTSGQSSRLGALPAKGNPRVVLQGQKVAEKPRQKVPGTAALQGPASPQQAPKDHADRLAWRFAYDDDGRPVEMVDPAGRKTATSYEFDAQKRLQTVTRRLADRSQVVWRFNRFGRCTEMQDSAGVVRYGHDGYGRLTSVRRDGMPPIAYDYDTLDRVTSIAVGDRKVEYVYDFLGRLANIKTPAGEIAYNYQTGLGEVHRTLPNGIVTIWKYRPDGALQSILHGRPVAGTQQIEVLCHFEYAYRADGLIARVKELNKTEKRTIDYEYDVMQRLKTVKDSLLGNTEYAYDNLGNRTELRAAGRSAVVSKFDWAGRLVEHDGRPCTHDGVGNLASLRSAGTVRDFEFNARNLLKSASGVGEKVEYAYDGDGALITRKAGSQRTTFVPDQRGGIWRPLLAIENGGKQTFYVWDGTSVIAAFEAGKVEFYLGDCTGSARCTVGGQGEVVSGPRYDAFGTVEQGHAAGDMRPGFAGLFFDPKCSLYVTLARSYDPSLGRFLQPEPGAPFPSLNDCARYVYCRADPINCVDRDGCAPNWVNNNSLKNVYNTPLYYAIFPSAHQFYTAQYDAAQAAGHAAMANGWAFLDRVAYVSWSFFDPVVRPIVKVADPGHLLTAGERARAAVEATGQLALFVVPEFAADKLATASGNAAVQADLAEMSNKPLHAMVLAERSIFLHGASKLTEYADNANTVWDAYQSVKNDPGPRDGGGRGGSSPMSASNVGGVYLGGAGAVFKDLGQLRGIAKDTNGRLVLLTGDQRSVHLPPLRLDDVVTVFRSVYLDREAPYVSIDPNPQDPRGPEMLTRHAKGTADTYVDSVAERIGG